MVMADTRVESGPPVPNICHSFLVKRGGRFLPIGNGRLAVLPAEVFQDTVLDSLRSLQ